MPDLPLHFSEPFAATLGIMLYPQTDVRSRRRARSFTSQYMSNVVNLAINDGHSPSPALIRWIARNCGEPLDDIEKRWKAGLLLGDLVKIYYALAQSQPDSTTWTKAVEIFELAAAKKKLRGSRSALWKAKKNLCPVTHLWAAWSIREGRFEVKPELGYDGHTDFQFFLVEAEILADFLEVWKQRHPNAQSISPDSVWRVPEGWSPPARMDGWPATGMIPHMELRPEYLAA